MELNPQILRASKRHRGFLPASQRWSLAFCRVSTRVIEGPVSWVLQLKRMETVLLGMSTGWLSSSLGGAAVSGRCAPFRGHAEGDGPGEQIKASSFRGDCGGEDCEG